MDSKFKESFLGSEFRSGTGTRISIEKDGIHIIDNHVWKTMIPIKYINPDFNHGVIHVIVQGQFMDLQVLLTILTSDPYRYDLEQVFSYDKRTGLQMHDVVEVIMDGFERNSHVLSIKPERFGLRFKSKGITITLGEDKFSAVTVTDTIGYAFFPYNLCIFETDDILFTQNPEEGELLSFKEFLENEGVLKEDQLFELFERFTDEKVHPGYYTFKGMIQYIKNSLLKPSGGCENDQY